MSNILKHFKRVIDYRKYLNIDQTDIFREVEKTVKLRQNQRSMEEKDKLLKEKDDLLRINNEKIAALEAQVANLTKVSE